MHRHGGHCSGVPPASQLRENADGGLLHAGVVVPEAHRESRDNHRVPAFRNTPDGVNSDTTYVSIFILQVLGS
jgi:hypothetical protein